MLTETYSIESSGKLVDAGALIDWEAGADALGRVWTISATGDAMGDVINFCGKWAIFQLKQLIIINYDINIVRGNAFLKLLLQLILTMIFLLKKAY